ncbi:hypothetical protein [Nonomuraea sp. C10]|uniref:hypothetical protein n=1 Tax=Nonomuraea sp. C10 TaxID=2600577 RepID=UPI0011CE3680|nr:hypothetical protein [Nonomuraea sp. C10]TXK41794.1 hypothetical protein FR742_21470 [Nonomuraea sp. C10]
MIDVSDPDAYDAGAVTVDVLATSLREPTVAAIVSFRHTAWLWLLPLALLGVAWAAARRRLDLRLDSLKFGEPAGAPPRTAKKQRADRRKNAAADRTGARKATTTSAHMARKATLQLRRAPEHGVSQSFSIGGEAAAKAAKHHYGASPDGRRGASGGGRATRPS